ncbi:MAG: reactive intermediate/imine deaminase [Actinobacteria bacterium RBG_16_68_21]|nr:MAG: reactive intermediate/imine deaminase [Actinobacteria bacterium RBG_16_68_21]
MPKSVPEVTGAPRPVGPYSVVTEANGFVFVSGQVGIDPATNESVGDDIVAQAAQVMANLGAILQELGLDYDDIVKTSIFLADIGDFAMVNDVYGRYFGERPPARSTFQAAGLPKGFLVEIEVIAAR